MEYDPEIDYYPTNPAAAICEYYGIPWDEVYWRGWLVDYDSSVRRILKLPKNDKGYSHVNIALYRMPSGSYEAITYRC